MSNGAGIIVELAITGICALIPSQQMYYRLIRVSCPVATQATAGIAGAHAIIPPHHAFLRVLNAALVKCGPSNPVPNCSDAPDLQFGEGPGAQYVYLLQSDSIVVDGAPLPEKADLTFHPAHPDDPLNPKRDYVHFEKDEGKSVDYIIKQNAFSDTTPIDPKYFDIEHNPTAVAARLDLTTGILFAKDVDLDDVWEVTPGPDEPTYVAQPLAQEAATRVTLSGDTATIRLHSYRVDPAIPPDSARRDRKIMVKPLADGTMISVLLGNTPLEELVPNRPDLEHFEKGMDHHFELYYRMFPGGPGGRSSLLHKKPKPPRTDVFIKSGDCIPPWLVASDPPQSASAPIALGRQKSTTRQMIAQPSPKAIAKDVVTQAVTAVRAGIDSNVGDADYITLFDSGVKERLTQATGLTFRPIKANADPAFSAYNRRLRELLSSTVEVGVFQVHGAPDPVHREAVAFRGDHGWQCSGVLIARNAIVSAGHCFGDSPRYAAVGQNLNGAGGEEEALFFDSPTACSSTVPDFCVVVLKKEVSTVTTFPTLADKSAFDSAQDLLLVGYGAISPDGDGVGTREQGRIVIRSKDCATLPSELALNCTPGYYVIGGGKKTLTGYFDVADEQGACGGDSGGPGYVTVGSEDLLASITSYIEDKPCSVAENVYMRVDPLSEWLKKDPALSGIKW
jgi:hypothetical protein